MTINLNEGINLKHVAWWLAYHIHSVNANHYNYNDLKLDLPSKIYFLCNLLPQITVAFYFQSLREKNNLFNNIIFSVPDTALDIEDKILVKKQTKISTLK